jgi:hypothetical protein
MWLVLWIIFSILVGVFASSKKRSGLAWFFLSLVLSPFITFIIVLVAGFPKGTLKKCPKCAEEVKAEALVCRFCGFDFSTPPVLQQESTPTIKAADSEIRDLASDYVNKMSPKK